MSKVLKSQKFIVRRGNCLTAGAIKGPWVSLGASPGGLGYLLLRRIMIRIGSILFIAAKKGRKLFNACSPLWGFRFILANRKTITSTIPIMTQSLIIYFCSAWEGNASKATYSPSDAGWWRSTAERNGRDEYLECGRLLGR